MDKLEKLKKLEAELEIKKLKEQLPHKYKALYTWQREFVDSINKINLCTAANQTGKSTWMIIRALHHAYERDLWPKLWPEMLREGKEPTMFFYLYEDKGMIMREFENKWIKEWLPRGEARYKGKYRWSYKIKDKCVDYIEFGETGVRMYFLSYGQGVQAMMASTAYEIFVDEELPFELYDELSARLRIPRGYFNAGFTAVRGQEQWRKAMEERGEEEYFKTAFKNQITVWDCKVKEDGTPGLYDDELIALAKAQCSTHAEEMRRLHGRFVKSEGLMVPQFDVKRHFVQGHKLNPKSWNLWGAIDPGSGGHAHPAGIVIMAINDNFTKGRVIKCWRGDNENTTNTQILQQYQDMTKGLKIVGTVYDKQSRDLFLQAVALDVALIPANKAREEGFGTLNSLLKHDMLKIYHISEGDHTHKLKNELCSYSVNHSKSKASCPDNLIDPLRYLCLQIPWNFDEVIQYNLTSPINKKEKRFTCERDKMIEAQENGRLQEYLQSSTEQEDLLSSELTEWDDAFGEYID